MGTGLRLLHGMGERGNSHMGARHELLAKLLSVIMPSGGDSSLGPIPQASVGHTPSYAAPATTSAYSGFQPPASFSQPPISGTDTDQLKFPIIDLQALAEPFYDESVNTGMDFGLWEEGFAYPTMDLDLNLAQQQPLTGRKETSSTGEMPANTFI